MKDITCPCNGKTIVLAQTPDRKRFVAACPECKAQTIPAKSKESAVRIWVSMRSESVKETVPT